jgi:anti-sigma B factor antagonist
MNLIVRSIDFATRKLTIEVGGSTSLSQHNHISRYFTYCRDVGFPDITIIYPRHMPLMSFVMLQELRKQAQEAAPVTLVPRDTADPTPPDSSRCFGCVREPGKDGNGIVYEFRSRSLLNMLDDLTVAVMLMGNSIPLDEESLLHMRLGLYELGANSVEHGRFDRGSPETKLRIAVAAGHLEITYLDNADEFCTVTPRRVDIGRNIGEGRKRGLGLFVLQSITTDLRYERDGIWNRTRFKIRRNPRNNTNLDRRTTMNNLKITTKPTERRDTAVVTPAGSINSSTVPHLDSCFGELFGKGIRTIVVDLSEAEFISSSGVGLLLGSVSSLREKDGDLVLMNIPSLINDIFDILNIKMHFRIIDSLDDLKTTAGA